MDSRIRINSNQTNPIMKIMDNSLDAMKLVFVTRTRTRLVWKNAHAMFQGNVYIILSVVYSGIYYTSLYTTIYYSYHLEL